MNKAALLAELMRLSPDERLKLGEELWESLVADEGWMPTPEQLAEARHRLEDHRRNPSVAIAAEKVLERLQSRFG
jgi:putative addiction module component (TIGR02574 family)